MNNKRETISTKEWRRKAHQNLKNKELVGNLEDSEETLEKMHNEIDRKICEKVFEKTRNCKWDHNDIKYQLESSLLKNSSIKPIHISDHLTWWDGDRISFVFKWKSGGDIRIDIFLLPQKDHTWCTYDLGFSQEEIDNSRNLQKILNSQNYQEGWPVKIHHKKDARSDDTKIKSRALLEEKQKLYESL